MIQPPHTSHEKPSDLRVLVAEDSGVNRRLAWGLLTREGHHVTLASNGAHAVSELRRSPYDVVLMDIEMPVMDGLTATRHIRQAERTTGRHVPVIALTTTSDQGQCLAAGMDGFLNKPLSLAAFRNLVAQLMRERSA